MKTFGINGFGRIGRTALRVWWQFHRHELELKMINTSGSMDIDDWVHLLKYDSNYGNLHEQIRVNVQQSKKDVTPENPVLGTITIGDGQEILVTAQRDPKLIPWGANGVHTVLESTGVFLTNEAARQHLDGGAQSVIISSPGKGGGVSTAVLGVNDIDQNQKIFSNASCTTNCVAPVAQVMVKAFGVQKAMLTTVHAYTDDQNLHDNSHRDLRRARSAGQNIIPTSTGAAITTGEVVPEIKGLFDGLAIRVPVATGSLSDMVFITNRPTTIEEVNQVFVAASQEPRWQGILTVTSDPIVSSDIKGRRESSIVDLSLTNVIGGDMVKVVSWYDNEWGYCNRLVEQVYHT
jgi:glyceraldehyde 3-phosphate dehydrogenase